MSTTQIASVGYVRPAELVCHYFISCFWYKNFGVSFVLEDADLIKLHTRQSLLCGIGYFATACNVIYAKESWLTVCCTQ